MNPFHQLTDTPPAPLPEWPGAAESYGRAYRWMAALAAKTYAEASPAPYIWNGRLCGYTQPEDITAMQKALADGTQETVEALNAKYREYWAKAA